MTAQKQDAFVANLAAELKTEIENLRQAEAAARQEQEILSAARERLDQGKLDVYRAREAIAEIEADDDLRLTDALLRGKAELGEPEPSKEALSARAKHDRLEHHLVLLTRGLEAQADRVLQANEASYLARCELLASAQRATWAKLLPKLSSMSDELFALGMLGASSETLAQEGRNRFVKPGPKERHAKSRQGTKILGHVWDELRERGLSARAVDNDSRFIVSVGDTVPAMGPSPAADEWLERLISTADATGAPRLKNVS